MREEHVSTPRTKSAENAAGPIIVYVVGAGHCGSTLLSLALDRHPEVFAVSEIIGLNAKISGWSKKEEDCRQHAFWSRVAVNYQQAFDDDFWSVPFGALSRRRGSPVEWARRNQNALKSVADTAGVSIVVDASKSPRRLEVLLQETSLDIRVIYLTRDARGITHSYDRKYAGLWHGLSKLGRVDWRARSIKKQYPDAPWLTLRYEDMTSNLKRTLRDICSFCGVDFDRKMLRPDTSSFDGVGGNRLRHKPLKKIQTDMSWEHEMPAWKKILVSLAFLNYSRRLGFPLLIFNKRRSLIS